MNVQQIAEYFQILEEILSLVEQQQLLKDELHAGQNEGAGIRARIEDLEDRIAGNLIKLETLKADKFG